MQIILAALSAPNLADYVTTALRGVVAILQADYAATHVPRAGLPQLADSYSLNDEETLSATKKSTNALPAMALLSAGPVIVPDIGADSRLREPDVFVDAGSQSAVSTTIHTRDGAYGTLTVYSTDPEAFDSSDAGVLQDVANAIGRVVDLQRDRDAWHAARGNDARLLSASQARQRWVADATNMMASAPTRHEALSVATRLAVGSLAQYAAVDIVTTREGAPRISRVALAQQAGEVAGPDMMRHHPVAPTDPHGTPRALRTGRPEVIEHVTDDVLDECYRDPETLEIMRQAKVKSFMCVPIRVAYQVVGTLCLSRTPMGDSDVVPFDTEDLALAEDLADCLALVIGYGSHNSIVPGTSNPSDSVKDNLEALVDAEPTVRTATPTVARLTPRQHEILVLLSHGKSYIEIGHDLHISHRTVQKHVRCLLRALGNKNSVAACNTARSMGLID